MYLANMRAVANLANSAGCKLTGPSISQEREPLTSGAMKIVTNSRNNIPPYMRNAKMSYMLSSSMRSTKQITKEHKIQTNCFPERVVKSKTFILSGSVLAPITLAHPAISNSTNMVIVIQSILCQMLTFLVSIIYYLITHRLCTFSASR